MKHGEPLKTLTSEEVDSLCEQVEAERQAEAEQKKASSQ